MGIKGRLWLAAIAGAAALSAQAPGGGGRGPGGPPAYPDRPPADPAAIARGQALYGVHCAFCHGSDARGGEGGPNLIRSQLVMNDQHGELVAQVVQNGRPDAGMPKIDLNTSQVSDVADFIHNFKVGGRDVIRNRPVNLLVGDARAGEQYFRSKCASCHSVTGDLKGFGGKFTDVRTLQQTWLAPGGGGRGGFAAPPPTKVPPATVTVTLASGQKVEGRLARVDDFMVALTEADGTNRSFPRNGDSPKVEVHDPLEPHRQLLPAYTDKDIHDLTAYLVTLK